MCGRAAILVVLTALLAAPSTALGQDSDAPKGALPHWLPSEQWVYQHWLPYDEGRLHRLLRVDRGAIWRHLRDDDRHNLAQLGRRRGWRPRALAAALVAPRRAEVSPARLRLLRERALRTLTQGHLSQHILFHSLHQTAIPNRAREIFGTASVEEFLRLRRAELSPLQIGALHGRTRAQMRRGSVRALRAMAARGVRHGFTSRRQARLLLDRQLRQVPRWLGQRRYNGPPRTLGPSVAELPAADFANRPQLSADGTVATWDAYRAKVPSARRLGEIRVLAAHPFAARAPFAVSHAVRSRRPRSAYNAALAAGGRFAAFELAEGNLNFAKRYGQMSVVVRDLAGGTTRAVSHAGRRARAPARTAYNPSISGDGRLVAFEATDAGRAGRPSRNGLWLHDTATGRRTLVGRGSDGASYAPRLSADGSTLAFTAPDAGNDGHARVYVREVATGRTDAVGPRGVDAGDPSLSADGRLVALVARDRVLLHDRVAGTLEEVAGPATARALAAAGTPVRRGGAGAFDPALSPDGRFLAFSLREGVRRGRPEGDRARVWLLDRATGALALVSRSTSGHSTEPAVADAGARVAFTSTAGDLSAAKPAGLPGVFVHDLAAGTTTLLSTHAVRRASAARAGAAPPALLLCPLAP